MIIVDTREQRPIWNPDYPDILRLKLDEGDYTTTELIGKAHIERKSPNDLYGSIIQGHARFRRELLRAQEKQIKLSLFIECPYIVFVEKRFRGGKRLKTPTEQLKKMIKTISEKYGVEFVWCEGRADFRYKALKWFEENGKIATN